MLMCACFFDLFKTHFAAILVPTSLASMAYWSTRWIPNPGVDSKVDSAFYSFEAGKMSRSNFWELSGRK